MRSKLGPQRQPWDCCWVVSLSITKRRTQAHVCWNYYMWTLTWVCSQVMAQEEPAWICTSAWDDICWVSGVPHTVPAFYLRFFISLLNLEKAKICWRGLTSSKPHSWLVGSSYDSFLTDKATVDKNSTQHHGSPVERPRASPVLSALCPFLLFYLFGPQFPPLWKGGIFWTMCSLFSPTYVKLGL